jgi:hypothetical protein
MITRGRLLDRIRVALAGSAAARVALGEESSFSMPDIRRAQRLASKLVFYYGMSDFGLTTWAFTPYSSDFVVGQNRPRKVVSVDAMDATADWPTKVEELRFDAQDPSDVTWHRCASCLLSSLSLLFFLVCVVFVFGRGARGVLGALV